MQKAQMTSSRLSQVDMHFAGGKPAAKREPEVIINRVSQGLCEFKLNRPKQLNSVNLAMKTAMIAELKRWQRQPETRPRALMISGNGGKAFAAGADIKTLFLAGARGEATDNNWFKNRQLFLDYNLSLQQVQALAFEQALQATQAGNYVQDSRGAWVKK